MYLVTGVSEERPDRQLMLEGGVEQRLLLQLLQLLRPHHVEGVGPQVRTVDKGGAQRFCNANRKLINYLFCKHFNYSIHGEKIQTKNSARSSFFTFLHIDLWKPTGHFRYCWPIYIQLLFKVSSNQRAGISGSKLMGRRCLTFYGW